MTGSMRKILVGVGIVALAQSAALAWMVAGRISLLKSGREIVVQTVPVDPRSLFRGYYQRLSYSISTVPAALARGKQLGRGALYVTLQKDAGGAWMPVALDRKLAAVSGPDKIVLKAWRRYGTARSWPVSGMVALRYGIERYYIPEGTGNVLETLARKQKLSVALAVDAKGNAAIKGLIIDGKLAYEEPLL